MKPAGHIAISSAIGVAVAASTGSPWALATTIGAGALVDADHTLDFYNWFVRGRTGRVFYLLHGWEYLALLTLATAFLGWSPLMMGALLGYLSHLVADQVANHAYRFTYSILYRAVNGFNIRRVSPWTIKGSTKDLRNAIKALPLGGYLAPLAALLVEQAVRRAKPGLAPPYTLSSAPLAGRDLGEGEA